MLLNVSNKVCMIKHFINDVEELPKFAISQCAKVSATGITWAKLSDLGKVTKRQLSLNTKETGQKESTMSTLQKENTFVATATWFGLIILLQKTHRQVDLLV